MELEHLASLVGTISGLTALILFLLNYELNKRKLKAETRNIELDGDLKSIRLINELTEKIQKQEVRIDKLEMEVKALKGENHDISHELQLYKKAAKKIDLCPNKDTCPMVIEFNKLKDI